MRGDERLSDISVAYDREIFLLQEFGGVSKSFAKNIEVMIRREELGIKPVFTFNRTSNHHINNSSANPNMHFEPARSFLQPKNSLQTMITAGPIRALSSRYSGGSNPINNADIGHATYYRPQKYDFKKIKRLAVTVHDFIPEYLNWNGIRNPHLGKSKLIQRADLIICISETTRDLLNERFKLTNQNVVVVPHGTDIVPREHKEEGAFSILYVGHRKGYKNFDLLVDALHGLDKVRPYQLWIAGPPLDQAELVNLESKLKGSWRHFLNPSDQSVKELYSKAAVHCITSKMEGFGMTAIESIGAGCPVIASDIPIFRETLRGNGILINPNESEDLRNALSNLMTDKTYFESMEDNLLEIRENYSWDSITPKLAEAYRGLF